MLKKDELRVANSCLNRARPDEPVFVLRAHDDLAPAAIRHWAAMAEGTHEPEKIGEALALADEMEDWQKQNVPQAVGICKT